MADRSARGWTDATLPAVVVIDLASEGFMTADLVVGYRVVDEIATRRSAALVL